MSNHYGIEIECFGLGGNSMRDINHVAGQSLSEKGWSEHEDGSICGDVFESECGNCDGSGAVACFCSNCDGSGSVTGSDDCDCCSGTGYINQDPLSGTGGDECSQCNGSGACETEEDCTYCEGNGESNESCYSCDGSGTCSEDDCGAEFVSPILRHGNKSFGEVRSMYSALNSLGAKVNETCGLHVHVDIRFVRDYHADTAREFFQFLINEYASKEDSFDAQMHKGRRESNNSYCKSMKGMQYDMIKSGHDRYHKLNLLSYVKHGTVEFRHHHATLDADEVIAWIRTCVAFVRGCKFKFENRSQTVSVEATL